MSPELVGAFEQQWPEVAQRLKGLLASKNVPSCKRDDIVQETGLRLFGMWEKVDRNRPVWPLAVTIALNLLRDEARRNPQREILSEAVPEMPAAHDVEDEGLARLELQRVRLAMAQLSPSHRDVLMNEITAHDDIPRPARNATKMMRLRARRALATLLETAVLRAGFVGFKIRQSLGMNDPFLPMRIGTSDSGATPAAALAIAALLIGGIQVQPARVAHASETPAIVSGTYGAGTLVSLGSDSLERIDTSDVLASLKAASLSAARDRAIADGSHQSSNKVKGNKAGHKSRGKKPGRTPNWGAPPPEESSPLEVPLPIGNVHLGAGVGFGAAGVQVGNRPGSSTPVCLGGVEPAGLGCGTAPPQKARVQAGAETTVDGEKVGVAVDEEVDTDVT